MRKEQLVYTESQLLLLLSLLRTSTLNLL